jgi:outer membrane immunogenic protein
MRRHLLAVFVACVSIAGATERVLSDGAPSYDYAPSYTPAPQGWRGFYLGAHLGGTWGSSEATDTAGAITLNDSWSAAPSGVVVGGTLGYNWQLGPMIYGLEGDLGYLGLAGSGGSYVPLGYEASTTTDTDFYMTLRGRLGVLVNGWMLYFTGGYLGADTTVSVLVECDTLFCTTPVVGASNSSFRNGWTLGGGFEAALEGAWTAKLEYLYYDLGSTTVVTDNSFSGGANTWNVETDGQLVRAGINYRFNSLNIGY